MGKETALEIVVVGWVGKHDMGIEKGMVRWLFLPLRCRFSAVGVHMAMHDCGVYGMMLDRGRYLGSGVVGMEFDTRYESVVSSSDVRATGLVQVMARPEAANGDRGCIVMGATPMVDAEGGGV